MEYIKKSQRMELDEVEIKKVRQVVKESLDLVRVHGDKAVRDMSVKFDGVDRENYQLSQSEVQDCMDSLPNQTLKDIEFAQTQIRQFAEKQKECLKDLEVETIPGVILGHKNIAIDSVGCYVPGGRYPMVASAHMSVLTAKVAGVPRIVTCAPPTNGKPVASIVAAQKMAGADEIYCLGGIQAIAAMGIGTEIIKPVSLIAGPGNVYVAEAKRELFGKVGIDLLAGPTETLVIADDTVDAEICAVDLLGQAEHGPSSPAVLLTSSRTLALETINKVEEIINTLAEDAIVRSSWKNCGEVIVADDKEEMVRIANDLAFEHVQVMTDNDEYFFNNLRNFGGLFLGARTNVAFGDKVIGTNHTLPTKQAAKYTGGLWVGKYIKTCTYQKITDDSASVLIGEYASRLCALEGFMGHKEQADIRVRRYS